MAAPLTDTLSLATAGILAGAVNAVAGGGTLISYPVMLWLGRNPTIANATNALALWPGSLGGVIGFRKDLADCRTQLRWLLPPSVVGGLLGGQLMLATPTAVLARLVPWLILGATLLLAAQEWLSRRLPAGHRSTRWWVGAALGQFAVGIYGGYFGAGMSILMLAVLGLMGETDIHRMNGLKNIFAVAVNVVASAAFVVAGAINWSDGLILGVSSLAGGWLGAVVARRVRRATVKRLVVVIGLIMAASLFLK